MIQNQQMHDVDIFLATVEKQIKYKPMIPEIKSDYIENGFTKEKAICETIKDMGTPENVSHSFNAIYHTRPTWNLTLPIMALLFIVFLRTYLIYSEIHSMLSFKIGNYFFFAIPVLFVTLYFIYPLIINNRKVLFIFAFLLCVFSFLINKRVFIEKLSFDYRYRLPIPSINLLLLILLIPIFSIIAYYLCNYGLKGLLFSM